MLPDPLLPPLSLYVHLPWCEQKCPYCDFNSHPLRQVLPEEDYVKALLQDLEITALQAGGRALCSVFFGGGTPSLFSAHSVAAVLESTHKLIGLADKAEITLEANPGSANAKRFAAYRDAGVNRLSLGLQSFSDPQLKALGRIHDESQSRQAVMAARDAGFEQINIDLMHGLPGQSTSAAAHDIESAIAFSPEHLSLYQLTIEPNTQFAAEPPPLPDEETCWQIRCTLEERATGAGFERYEVSAFSRPVNRCRHNLNYWEFGDYIGIGAGAHAKITDRHGVRRYAREKHPRRYIETAVTGKLLPETHPVTGSELAFEFVLNALRLKEGFSVALFEQRTGLSWHCLSSAFELAKDRGLLNITNDQVCATTLGYRFLDDLVGLFLPTPA